ncbi:hypothetical protein BHYA_0002g01130 [Botrytis hyacinthi]|uniref:Uncharacterized protein n=1 Tax=Botrytis hyacinthi TaxID=278943 RepID=A0A4Z1H310_9HELO|nr:hypothetical protein BHYA_0002g01130 [Botrytis hyacinthi]
MIMIMSERDKATVSSQAKNFTKDSMKKADGPPIGSTRKSVQTSTSRRGALDSKHTTIVDKVQNSTRNDITMEINLVEKMKMDLDFGSMRIGPPSSDGDSGEQKKPETSHFNSKESNSG